MKFSGKKNKQTFIARAIKFSYRSSSADKKNDYILIAKGCVKKEAEYIPPQ